MAPVDPDKLRHHLDYARANLRHLERIREEGRESFLEDERTQMATVRLLHTAIEALLDCGHHVIAREGLGIPRSYSDTITLLVEADILPREDSDTFQRMVRFRNLAVHLYDEVAAEEVWKIVEDHLPDLNRFIGAIGRRYLSEPEPASEG
ncbi:MAG TPA: DUF86 domain-containing protein [Thermoanaerobaculia bacterium]|nr:DUF86 domain-containing protein [Thermoanaerobaculia bacterium]